MLISDSKCLTWSRK